jgi:two-component system OmpR family sensor kinase
MPLRIRPSFPGHAPLRARVLAGVLAVTLVVLGVFDVAAVTALRRYLYGQTDTQLHNVLALYRPFNLIFPPSGGASVDVRRQAVSARRGPRFVINGPRRVVTPALLDQYYVEVIAKGLPKPIVSGNSDLEPRLPANLTTLTAHARAETVTSANGRAQLLIQATKIGGFTLIVTTSLAGVHKTLNRLELILIIGSACAALLVGLGGAFVLRRGMRPIETMAAEADRISAGDLTDRVGPDDASTEVGRLGAALNGMLARIENSVREREAGQELTNRFFADASHELRTPLASLRANAELYQQGALTERYQVDEAMRRIVIESQRMGKLVDDMLRLARLDQHPGQQCEPVDLTALVSDCFDEAAATDPWRTWRADIADDLATLGDAELLRRAISNLLSNVSTHTPDGTTATVTAARQNGTVTISVSDNGPGVPPDQVHRIFDRFYRGTAPSPRPGAGLGLAIVEAIAAGHDGRAEAACDPPHGLRVTLTLPATVAADLAPVRAQAGR